MKVGKISNLKNWFFNIIFFLLPFYKIIDVLESYCIELYILLKCLVSSIILKLILYFYELNKKIFWIIK